MTMIKMEMGSPPLLLLAPPPVVSMSTSILLMGPANNEKRKNIRYVYQVISTLSALLFLIKRIQNKFFKKNIAQNISRAVLINYQKLLIIRRKCSGTFKSGWHYLFFF